MIRQCNISHEIVILMTESVTVGREEEMPEAFESLVEIRDQSVIEREETVSE